MNSRERVFRALNFEEPDRVPIDLWISKGFEKTIQEKLGMSKQQFFDMHDVDFRYIEGPRYIGPPLETLEDGSTRDIWGVPRKCITIKTAHGQETYHEVEQSPLASAKTIDEIYAYEYWPSPDWFDYSCIETQCEDIRKQERVVVFMGDRLNRIAQLKPAMYIRGVEQIFMDMSLAPDIAKAVISKIRAFYDSYSSRIFEAANGKLDIVLTGDDFGSQHGLLVSKNMWIEFLKEGFENYIDIARSFDIRVMHHTCGAVEPLIPLMIECGLDILQSLQPEAFGMDARALKRSFGNQLSFSGGISIQRTLPFGTVTDIRNEVKDLISVLAEGGGYIFGTAHNIQSDVPLENVQELLRAFKEYASYV
jgi:uroporphyrinogen decarboxylase